MKFSPLKKLYIRLFTRKPYKIRKFSALYGEAPGKRVDKPEKPTFILNTEHGSANFYPPVSAALNHAVIERYIGKEKRFASSGVFKEPDRMVYSVSNGCVWGPLGLIYDPDERAYIAESAHEWLLDITDSVYTSVVNFPPAIKLKGVTVSCLTNGADFGFYHFLFESLSRVLLYRSFIHQADFILFNGPSVEWKLKWIKRANLDTSKIIWVDNKGHFECEQLIFTSKPVNDQQVNRWCINSLKDLFNIPLKQLVSSKTRRVIWISRKGLSDRDIKWEDEILAIFTVIEKVDLSVLSDAETIDLMNLATHVIGPHGAGFSNLYLCNTGTKVLEIYPVNEPLQPCYYRLSTLCDLKHSIMYLQFSAPEDKNAGLITARAILNKFLC